MGLNVFKRRCAHRILGELEECPECVATMRARALEIAGTREAKPLHTQPFRQPTREDVAGAIGQAFEELMKSGVLPGNASVSGDTVTLSAGPRKDNPDMSEVIGPSFDALNSGGFRVASSLGHLYAEVNSSARERLMEPSELDGARLVFRDEHGLILTEHVLGTASVARWEGRNQRLYVCAKCVAIDMVEKVSSVSVYRRDGQFICKTSGMCIDASGLNGCYVVHFLIEGVTTLSEMAAEPLPAKSHLEIPDAHQMVDTRAHDTFSAQLNDIVNATHAVVRDSKGRAVANLHRDYRRREAVVFSMPYAWRGDHTEAWADLDKRGFSVQVYLDQAPASVFSADAVVLISGISGHDQHLLEAPGWAARDR